MTYKIVYLPLARNDLHDIVLYLSETLKAPQAANDFLDALDHSVSLLSQFPFSHQVYQPLYALEDTYRSVRVKNYLVFYVVYDDIVEIRRVVYVRRDIASVITDMSDTQI